MAQRKKTKLKKAENFPGGDHSWNIAWGFEKAVMLP